MKSAILATFVALLVFASPVFADVATGEVGASASPGDQQPKICVYNRTVTVDGINLYGYRTGLYAFTGEQIQYYVVVRDPNGALDIGFVKAIVGGAEEVLANPTDLPETCNGFGYTNNDTDKAFEITITVEPGWYGDTEVALAAYNSAGDATQGTHTENWFFNPSISIDVSTSDGQPIHFEQMPYGADTLEERTVHSLNKLKVKNTAEGGVNLWMFIAGSDLYDPSGASKCPTTNYIDVEKYMKYRGWSGTLWSGDEGWKQMSRYDQNDACSFSTGTCYGGTGVPDDGPEGNILTNQGTLEVEFKLTYPMPCIGTFSDGTIYIFGKAI